MRDSALHASRRLTRRSRSCRSKASSRIGTRPSWIPSRQSGLSLPGRRCRATETDIRSTIANRAGLNLLVGRNGSGKSNFFSAIRFVLSDAYTSLSREERQALLHDSGGAGGGATMSAFVEIEFDNADGRFPTSEFSVELAPLDLPWPC